MRVRTSALHELPRRRTRSLRRVRIPYDDHGAFETSRIQVIRHLRVLRPQPLRVPQQRGQFVPTFRRQRKISHAPDSSVPQPLPVIVAEFSHTGSRAARCARRATQPAARTAGSASLRLPERRARRGTRSIPLEILNRLSGMTMPHLSRKVSATSSRAMLQPIEAARHAPPPDLPKVYHPLGELQSAPTASLRDGFATLFRSPRGWYRLSPGRPEEHTTHQAPGSLPHRIHAASGVTRGIAPDPTPRRRGRSSRGGLTRIRTYVRARFGG